MGRNVVEEGGGRGGGGERGREEEGKEEKWRRGGEGVKGERKGKSDQLD